MNKQRQDLIKAIYKSLKSGEILRGDKLFSERELCEIFGVKRSILREALISLETLNIIDIRERQGMFLGKGNIKSLANGLDFLTDFSPLVIHDKSMEVRLMVEPMAASLAASYRTEKHCEILKEEIAFLTNLKKMEDKRKKAILSYQHNIIIHNTIIEAADNLVLAEIYKYLSTLTRNVFSMLGDSPLHFYPYELWPDILHAEHIDIVNAIIDGDSSLAHTSMKLHLEHSLKRNKEIMSKEGSFYF